MYGLNFRPSQDGEIMIAGFGEGHENYGLQRGDILLKIHGEEVNFNNFRPLLAKRDSMNIGDEFKITVRRGEEELEFTGKLFQRYKKHVFEPKDNLSNDEMKFKKAWIRNL
jgi:S1-C subfamily serine protease